VPQPNSLVRLHQHSMSELLSLLPNLPLTVTGSIRSFEVEVASNQGKFPSLIPCSLLPLSTVYLFIWSRRHPSFLQLAFDLSSIINTTASLSLSDQLFSPFLSIPSSLSCQFSSIHSSLLSSRFLTTSECSH
jgi:hypothetical protein